MKRKSDMKEDLAMMKEMEDTEETEEKCPKCKKAESKCKCESDLAKP